MADNELEKNRRLFYVQDTERKNYSLQSAQFTQTIGSRPKPRAPLHLTPLSLSVVLSKSIPATLLTSPVLGLPIFTDFDETKEHPHCLQLPN